MTTKKAINTDKLLRYLSDPENEFLNRTQLALTVLGYANEVTLYRHFTPAELQDIENEALKNRKRNAARQRACVLAALYREATNGNVQAAKEWMDRVEGKVTDKIDADLKVSQKIIIRRKTRDGDE